MAIGQNFDSFSISLLMIALAILSAAILISRASGIEF